MRLGQFYTENKTIGAETMTELLTAAQMRAIEQAAIDSGEVTGLELMERAGQGVLDAILTEWPELRRVGETHRAVVLCGPGNNGGDGFVVARLLKEAGWAVEVFLYGDVEKLPPDAKVNYERWLPLGQTITLGFPIADAASVELFMLSASSLPELQNTPNDLGPKPFFLIDALFGTGLSRPISGLNDLCAQWDYLTNFRDLNASRVIAIDIPSGLDTDSGLELYEGGANPNAFAVLAADLTVTFHRMKLGHVLSRGPVFSGKTIVVDIGL